MTEHTQRGTGKHGREDAQKPWPRHEASDRGSGHASAKGRERSEEREGSRPDGTSRVERKFEDGNLKSPD